MNLSDFLTGQIFGYCLVLCRIGTIVMFIPGFGEQYIPARVKILFATFLSFALYPAVPVDPIVPSNLTMVFTLILIEITIGVWIGAVSRGIIATLQYAGHQVGQVSALANAFASNLGSFQGASMVASFLLITGLALIFLTDTHHVMIEAMIFSYQPLPVGSLPLESMVDQMARATASVMYIGVSLAAPFFVLGVLNNVGLGLANRMMPTLPVFFVASSVLIGTGLLIFSFAAPYMLNGFLDAFTSWLHTFKL